MTHLYYKTHPDFGEFPAQIFSDHQFGQNLQYKSHPEFWLFECRLLTKCEVDPHGPSCSEWPIHRRQRHFVDCQGTRMTQMTKDFAMRHNENYVEWNSISVKSHQFVTNCPYQTIYSKHSICSYKFLLRYHDSFAGRLHNQIRNTWLWKIDT